MSKVYFKAVSEKAAPEEIRDAAGELFSQFISREKVSLGSAIPLKVHFGEKGNRTFLAPELYDRVIDILQQKGISSVFMESSVLYGGERFKKENHIRLAHKHGFTRLDVVIADGESGEEARNIPVDKPHFKYCSIAKELADSPQTLVLSHFKGHALAGFGGAVKQLSMGFASKGGKMAMHLSVKPKIWNFLCKKCNLCVSRCQHGAITIGKKSFIDHNKCIGCGACFSICPRKAVSIYSLEGLKNALFQKRSFREKLAEYAYAAHHGKKNLYMNFAVNITAGCDCEPRPMMRCTKDIGIFMSEDPIAIDQACLDASAANGKKFKGVEQLLYGEKIGLGSVKYELVTLH